MSRKNSKTNKELRRAKRAEKKAKNQTEEKRSRPNNLLLAILIFGLIAGMVLTGLGIKYFQKEKSIETYIKSNPEMFSDSVFDEHSTVNVTAKKNKMNIEINATSEDKDIIKDVKDYYTGEDASKNMKFIGAYYLMSVKPETRAIFADAHVSVKLNDKEIAHTDLTYFDAKRILEGTYYTDEEEEAETASEDAEAADD